MDLDDADATIRYLIRDRDGKYPILFDQILGEVSIQVVFTGVRMPRMNAIMERWVQTCRRELLDRILIWNDRHLRHALHEFEQHDNAHRSHQALNQAPLRENCEPITDLGRTVSFCPNRQRIVILVQGTARERLTVGVAA